MIYFSAIDRLGGTDMTIDKLIQLFQSQLGHLQDQPVLKNRLFIESK